MCLQSSSDTDRDLGMLSVRSRLLGLLASCFWQTALSALPGQAWAQFDKQAWPAKLATPALDVVDIQGRRWTLAQLKGKPVVLNFWATWCAPCKEELPSLQALHESGSAGEAGEKAVVIGINVKEPWPRVSAFVNNTLLSLPVVLDERGDLARQWGARIYPTTVLIAPDGRARWRVVGELDWNGPLARDWLSALRR